jgi:hypothetical protein
VAGRSTCDGCQTGEGLADVVLRLGVIDAVTTKLNLSTHCTDPAGIGINHTAAYSNVCRKTEIVGSLLGECGNLLTCGVELVILQIIVSELAL